MNTHRLRFTARMAVAALLVAFYVGALVPGCSDDSPVDPDPPGSGDAETVSTPIEPIGASVLDIDDEAMYSTGGAASSLAHPIEYRFDFGTDAAPEYTSWSGATVSLQWTSAGTYRVRAQARCQLHPNIESDRSPGKTVEVGLGPDTELFKITTTYTVGGQTFVDSIDFTDSMPDTVPFGSRLTLYYRGIDSMNGLVRFQARYARDSSRNVFGFAEIPWVPPTPENTNAGLSWDTTSMNMGSVEYDIFVRTVDFFNRQDPTPAQVPVVGNFDPILDGFQLIDQDGGLLADSDTLELDWWAPADSGFTAGVTARFKTFFFVIKATGHDHAMDPDTSAVKAWFYDFARDDDPGSSEIFGRSGGWFDSDVNNALCDTAWIRLEYPLLDVLGDEIFINNPPRWQNTTFNFTLRGRDARALERFQQYVVFTNQQNLMNDYTSGRFGRWTPEGLQGFHLRLVR